ncbi:MAG: hypothetical protein WBK75_03630 [Acutalibacteraceae bacterium]|jgi:hypothetical protein|nr:hypothetical protein [Clostridiales bacterium]
MDTLIEQGDFAVSANGLPIQISDTQELLQRAIFCLSIPRGSFLHDKELGSRFFELKNSKLDAKNSIALSMAQEALKNQPQISVYSAQIEHGENKEINAVKVLLLIDGNTQEVMIKI